MNDNEKFIIKILVVILLAVMASLTVVTVSWIQTMNHPVILVVPTPKTMAVPTLPISTSQPVLIPTLEPTSKFLPGVVGTVIPIGTNEYQIWATVVLPNGKIAYPVELVLTPYVLPTFKPLPTSEVLPGMVGTVTPLGTNTYQVR